MLFELGYGEKRISATVRASHIEVLEAVTPPPIAHLPEAFRAAVEENAIESEPLKALLTPADEVTVVISDITRAWMHQDRICPLLMDYLHDVVGLPYEHIVFLVALGTHRPMTDAELRRLTGERVLHHVRVLNHEADQPLRHLGVTSRGTKVAVSPWVVGRKVILMGGTVHHLLAGYGGGRKSILPGVAGDLTIRQNHIHALHQTEPRSSDDVGMGVLHGNPVHEDMMEAAAMVAPVFGINLVVDGRGDHIALPSGHYIAAWEESCRLVDRFNGVSIAERFDAVVVSCGGFPKDLNLFQASKTMINARQAVKDGGRVVFLAECPEGGGPAAFFGWSKPLAEGRLDAALREDFTIAGYVFYVCCEIAAHTDFHMLSRLPADVLHPMRIHGIDEAELPALLDFGGGRVAVMPYGSSTVPMQKVENGG